MVALAVVGRGPQERVCGRLLVDGSLRWSGGGRRLLAVAICRATASVLGRRCVGARDGRRAGSQRWAGLRWLVGRRGLRDGGFLLGSVVRLAYWR